MVDGYKENVTQKAQRTLHTLLSENRYEPILLLVSGGSSFVLLEDIGKDLLGSHVTISVLDERYSTDPEVNNFAQLTHTSFYQKAQESNCYFIDTRVKSGESHDAFALRFEDALRDWKEKNPNGKVIITQGIGEDGHTAGIMPFPENPELFATLFEDSKKCVVGYDAIGKNPYRYRVTVTIPFLTEVVDHAVVYAVGEKKQKALQDMQNASLPLAEVPAKVVLRMKNAILFQDVLA